MKLISFFLFFFPISMVYSDGKGKPNFGTVLFSESDVKRNCYGTEEIALLTARMMLQDLLPQRSEPKIEDNKYIDDVVEYFRMILEVVGSKTTGKGRHIMLMALTDTLGGYMNKILLPVAKYAYYAGKINYSSVVKLYELFAELKAFLRTSGLGWATPPESISSTARAEALQIPPPLPHSDACKGLIYYREYPIHKRSSENDQQQTGAPRPFINIPMPFFDSKSHPSAMAVPFKTYSLRNVESKSAAYVLLKYYVASRKCLASQNADEISLQNFQSDFYSFLNRKVIPHLSDDRFFSAFGGVLRITETLRSEGVRPSSEEEYNKNVLGVHGGAPVTGPPQTFEENEGGALVAGKVESEETTERNEAEYAGGVKEEEKKKKSSIILYAALVTIFFWFLIGAFFICCKMRAAKLKSKEEAMANEEEEIERKSSKSKGSSITNASKLSSSRKEWEDASRKGSKPSQGSQGSEKTKTSYSSRRSKKSKASGKRTVSEGVATHEEDEGTYEQTHCPISWHGNESTSRSSSKGSKWRKWIGSCSLRGSSPPRESERGGDGWGRLTIKDAKDVTIPPRPGESGEGRIVEEEGRSGSKLFARFSRGSTSAKGDRSYLGSVRSKSHEGSTVTSSTNSMSSKTKKKSHSGILKDVTSSTSTEPARSTSKCEMRSCTHKAGGCYCSEKEKDASKLGAVKDSIMMVQSRSDKDEETSTLEDSGEDFATGPTIDPRCYYDAKYACHTSLTGKYRISSNTTTTTADTKSQHEQRSTTVYRHCDDRSNYTSKTSYNVDPPFKSKLSSHQELNSGDSSRDQTPEDVASTPESKRTPESKSTAESIRSPESKRDSDSKRTLESKRNQSKWNDDEHPYKTKKPFIFGYDYNTTSTSDDSPRRGDEQDEHYASGTSQECLGRINLEQHRNISSEDISVSHRRSM